MRSLGFFLGVGGLLLLSATGARAQSGDLFEFFAEEAQVITASRRPQAIRQAPATVHVVEGEDLRASGAHTLWDVLRPVPGVDVMSIRTLYGTVSIRGLNKVLNNRTLVLVDGRRELDDFTHNVNWESVPVLLEEIERIEVVEGPASALYGPNAVNGVINIITKDPGDLQGGQVGYTFGERQTHLGTFLYGGQWQKLGYKLGVGCRTANRYENADQLASKSRKYLLQVGYQLAPDTRVGLAAGWTWLDTDVSLSGLGPAREDGRRGFARADYATRTTRLRLFWNQRRTILREFISLPHQDPELNYDTFDLNLERTLTLSSRHTLVAGGSLRRTVLRSHLISPDRVERELWALFFESEWHPAARWTLWTSGRIDRHTHTGLVFSPRFSAVFTPVPEHVLRFSAGTSYRNPTLFENRLAIVEHLELSGPFTNFDLSITGDTELDPERILFFELAHSGRIGRIKTTVAGFHYRLQDVVALAAPTFAVSESTVAAATSFVNQGETRAWGGEAGAEVLLRPQVESYLNYSYQHLRGELDPQAAGRGTPNHKLNTGLRYRRDRLDASVSIHWMSRTLWRNNQIPSASDNFEEVEGYTLVNAHLGYGFGGRWQNLELGLDAFNLLDESHFEILPPSGLLTQGQGGEIIRSRRTLTLKYRF